MQPCPHTRRSFLAAATTAVVGLALKPSFGESQDLAALTLKQASELLRREAASPVDLTHACLKRIERYNSALNAFITVTSEQALGAAREMEAEQRRGQWRGFLHGIPIALKDNIDTAGTRTTAASELFKDRVPSEDAEVVRRLKNAGAILLGKTNLHEFAYGGSFLGQLLWARAQSLGTGTDSGRIVGWFSRRYGRRTLLWIVGNGYRRVRPNPRLLLRDRGLQAHLWPREQSWSGAPLLDSGPCRTAVQNS